MYGISQHPDTKNYIIVLEGRDYCEKCGEKYKMRKWCKPCQINDLGENFKNWTSSNEKIDDFIQEMQLKINSYHDIVFEWVPYNQFKDIKEIDGDNFSIVYSATWNGPLKYDENTMKYKRYPSKVALKCLCGLFDTHNNTDEFLSKV